MPFPDAVLYVQWAQWNTMRIGIRKLTFKDYSDIVMTNFSGFYFFTDILPIIDIHTPNNHFKMFIRSSFEKCFEIFIQIFSDFSLALPKQW